MRRKYRKNSRVNSEINIVPYVDVMFVLLTIFMVTATTISVGVDVDPPELESSQQIASEGEEMMVISVDQNGLFYFNLSDTPNDPLPREDIESQAISIFETNNTISALVKGDKDAPYGKVIEAMGILQGITNKNVQLMTSPLSE